MKPDAQRAASKLKAFADGTGDTFFLSRAEATALHTLMLNDKTTLSRLEAMLIAWRGRLDTMLEVAGVPKEHG